MELYSKDMLRWATRIQHVLPIEPPFVDVSLRSRVCGSHMAVFADVQKGVIDRFSWDIHLCAAGQAVCGILSKHILGLSAATLDPVDDAFRRMVTTGAAVFPADFREFGALASVADFPARHGSVLLPFDCLKEVFNRAA